ncbi:hypothetical protein U1Q18_001165 [Sarracenia purpurea var. burkii]
MVEKGDDQKLMGIMEEMMAKCWRKLKKMMVGMFPDDGSSGPDHNPAGRTSVLRSRRCVHCDELFLPYAGGTKSRPGDDDPVIAAHLAAQRHFSMRPNLYL